MPPFRSPSSRPAVGATPARAPEDDPAGHADQKNAVEHADQADVQPHVAVEDVAELVGDDPLQLVARQVADTTTGHANHGVARRVAGGEGVDAVLLLHQIDGRHRRPGGDGHLLDDVEDLALVGVGRRGREGTPAHQLGHVVPAAGQRGDPEEASTADQGEHRRRHGREEPRVPESREIQTLRRSTVLIRGEERRRDQPIREQGDQDDGDDEVEDQEPGLPAGRLLVLEEIHVGLSRVGPSMRMGGRPTRIPGNPRATPGRPIAAA